MSCAFNISALNFFKLEIFRKEKKGCVRREIGDLFARDVHKVRNNFRTFIFVYIVYLRFFFLLKLQNITWTRLRLQEIAKKSKIQLNPNAYYSFEMKPR